MKLFKLGKQPEEAPEFDPAEADEAILEEEYEPEDEGPDATELLDQTMRQVTDRMQRMSTTLDSISQDRKSFESKLGEMDERMRKLSMLTEMMSNRYNPFIGSEVQPTAGGGTAPAAQPPAPVAKPRADVQFHFPAIRDAGVEARRDDSAGLPPPPGWARDPDTAGTATEFQRQLGILALSEHILAETSRVGALDLLGFYERLGWMGPQLRRDVLIAMEGLPCTAGEAAPAERRAAAFRPFPAEFHARSLALLHRIRGSRLTEEDLALLRRDFQRLAGE